MRPIYLDNHATTRTDPRVVEAMLPFFTEAYGNASSRTHAYGWEAEEAVERARTQVADLIGASAKEILFTSGATESINLALKGVAGFYGEQGGHIVTTAVEHKAVLDVCGALQRRGLDATLLPVDRFGRVSPEDVERALRPDTLLVSVLLANNEIGTLNPVASIGRLCKARGVLYHVDGAQAVGKIPLDVDDLAVDLLSLSGHKIYGPKGVGALYVRRRDPRVRLVPLLDGGGHERGMRSGTLNVPGIVGLGAACVVCAKEMPEERERIRTLRDHLEWRLTEELDGVRVNGHPDERLDGNLNVSFERVEGETLLASLRGLAVSSGSACTSATVQPSHVLRAIGLGPELAHSALRFGLGRFTTREEIDTAASQVVASVQRLRAMAPPETMPREGDDP
jgi:cysteine desulfurase